MIAANNYLNATPTPSNKTILVKSGALNEDIIKALHDALPLGAVQAKELAQKFKQDTRKKTAFAVWRFLRNAAVYNRDDNTAQNIRLPARFIHDTFKKFNSGDCKSFSLFSASIFSALGIPVYFVYAGYKGRKTPSHVYTMIEDEQGEKIFIDGCYFKFNSEKKPTFKKIYKMNINYLAGPGFGPGEKIGLSKYKNLHELRTSNPQKFKALCLAAERLTQVKAANFNRYGVNGIAKKLTKEEKKTRRKKRNEKAKKGLKKFGWGVAFINLLPIRAAFTAIVAMNINAFAHNLKWIQENGGKGGKTQKEWEKILKVWYSVGGLKKALFKAIQLGAKHKPLFLSKKRKAKYEARRKGLKGFEGAEFIGDLEYIGIGSEVVIAAAVAAASGIIAALIPAVMSALKKGGKEQQGAAQEVTEQGQEMVQEAQNKPQFTKQVEQAAEQETQEVEGLGYAYEGLDGIAADYSGLVTALGEVAKIGITAAGNAVAKKVKKNPKAKKFLETAAQAGDDYATGTYLRRAGYTDRAKSFTQSAAFKYAPWIIGGVGILGIGAAVLMSRGKK